MSQTLSRRDALKLFSAGLAAWALPVAPVAGWRPRLAFFSPEAGPQGDILICVFLRGAMDGLNAVIPFTEKDYFDARPTLAIPEPKSGDEATALNLDDFFGLHPSLRPFKDLWDEGTLAIVHAAGSPDPTHSHFEAMDYMERGTPGEKQVPSGWLARHLETLASENASPFRAVGFGAMLQASLRGSTPALALSSVEDFHLGGRRSAPELERFQAVLSNLYRLGSPLDAAGGVTLSATETLAQVVAGEYHPEHGAEYPATPFGQTMRQVAQLIKAEVGLEVAAVDLGGWDTHINQGALEGQMPSLLTDLSQSLFAFYVDMGEQMKRITVVTMSEFGRRVAENGGGGTDHGHGNVMFVLGGGINGGKVYGEWPGLSPEVLYGPGDLAVTTDFRTVLGEIVQKRLRNDQLDRVFPGFTFGGFLGLAQEPPTG